MPPALGTGLPQEVTVDLGEAETAVHLASLRTPVPAYPSDVSPLLNPSWDWKTSH